MRADRLVAALLILQARGRVTAGQLAAELEVSVKTARRDLEALATAGIPVYAERGRGGGWTLMGGARTDLTGLTLAEAHALFLLAGPSAEASPAIRSALRKLLRALPEPFRPGAEAAASAVVLDPASWGGRRPRSVPYLEQLQQAIVDGRQVILRYASRGGGTSDRTVHPLGLAQKGTAWYLLANTENGLRTYRLDRITNLSLTDEPVRRPADFDVEAAWRAAVETTEARRRAHTAVVRAPARVLPWLRKQFGEDLASVRSIGDDVYEMTIAGPSTEWLAEHLAGWGWDVEVLQPQEVRVALARIGAELVERYGPPVDDFRCSVRGIARQGSS